MERTQHRLASGSGLVATAIFAGIAALAIVARADPAPPRTAPAEQRASLPAGVHRVVFLGDSITYAGAYACYVEAYFATRWPDRDLDFINIGLPSETVSGLSEKGHAGGKFPRPDLHERLARALEQTRPDLVFACYGMNDGIYEPFDEGRFARYREGMTWLHNQVVASGARIIELTPPVFDEVKGGHPGYRAVLDRYAQWLLDQRKKGWIVADLHGPMSRRLDERRQSDPAFAFAGDGVHPSDFGHWIMARSLLECLGARGLDRFDTGEAMAADYPHGKEILALVRKRQALTKDAWLTAIGHKRPGMNRGEPLEQAKQESAKLEKQIHELAREPAPSAKP